MHDTYLTKAERQILVAIDQDKSDTFKNGKPPKLDKRIMAAAMKELDMKGLVDARVDYDEIQAFRITDRGLLFLYEFPDGFSGFSIYERWQNTFAVSLISLLVAAFSLLFSLAMLLAPKLPH